MKKRARELEAKATTETGDASLKNLATARLIASLTEAPETKLNRWARVPRVDAAIVRDDVRESSRRSATDILDVTEAADERLNT